MACDTPIFIKVRGYIRDVPVPCSRCPNCKRSRVSQWTFRLQQEDRISSSSYFITLTYDTRHVPISPNGFMTLRKEDIQLFWKRLRKYQKAKIKYYLAGEYGEKTWRPHYHAIVFNVEDPEYFNKAWQLGNVHVGKVSGASIAYTAKYIDKNKRIPVHRNDDRMPERSFMSKGLGKNYLTPQIRAWHKAKPNERNYVSRHDGVKLSMPRYYRDELFTETEKKAQVKHVIKMKGEEMEKKRKKVLEMYKGRMTYEQHEMAEKIGRYNSFYNKIKTRD